MAIVYFHSSAFVKLVVEEAGTELAAALWDGCDAAVSSRLAYPEVRSALAAANSTDTVFAVWDYRLRTGAAAAGIRTAPPA